jgi:hypothetical protein
VGELPLTADRDDRPAEAPEDPAGPAGTRPQVRPARGESGREKPVLPDVSRDETDVGWGDEPGERDDDWYRRERPPHHE